MGIFRNRDEDVEQTAKVEDGITVIQSDGDVRITTEDGGTIELGNVQVGARGGVWVNGKRIL